MRRRLVVLSLATTVLVVIAFVVPLALLVRRQAADSAKVGAERDAQSVASLVALALAGSPPDAVAGVIGDLPEGTIVVLGEETLGRPLPGQGSLVDEAAVSSATVAGEVEGGWEIALPVIGPGDIAVVNSHVTAAQLTAGVSTAWTLLGLLALVLIGVAVWVADRLGRSLTRPVEELAFTAHRLAEGDLTARVEPTDPEEMRDTGEAFNYLADRLDHLLAEERESVADLSHRLRTPLTSLRLQAEALGDPSERAAMVAQVDRLEHSMSQMIDLARSRAAREPATSLLDEVVETRAGFWSVLAEEQERGMEIRLGAPSARVGLGFEDLAAMIDTLVGNVFAHTAPGTEFEIGTGVTAGRPWLEVSDRGPGFGDPTRTQRGVSGSGSTGLGVDIVRKTALSVGGSLQVDDRPGGGAVVRVVLG